MRIGDTQSMLALARRHIVFVSMLAAAALLRVLVMVAYQPAFWYFGDSGYYIDPAGGVFHPQQYTAVGYTIVLQVFERLHTFVAVVAVQHLAGLLIAVALYAFLRRRDIPIWMCCLAAAPVLFDSLQVTLEHYLLTETMCTALLVGGVVVLLWRPAVGVKPALLSGLLIGLAWVTRPNISPIIVLLAGYLVIRRVGWRPFVALVGAFLVPYLAIQMWTAGKQSVYNGKWGSRALYGHAAMVADCEHLKLTAEERRLCPTEPLGQRADRADWYGWNGPAKEVSLDESQVVLDFSLAVITQQPGDWTALVAKETAAHFVPGMHLGPQQDCLRERWTLPSTAHDTGAIWDFCHAGLAQDNYGVTWRDPQDAPEATALTRGLARYSDVVRLSPIVFSVSFLLVLGALFVRRRSRADLRDAVLLLTICLSLIVLPVVVAMYEARYGLLALPFASVMAALAGHHILASRRPEPGGDAAEPATLTAAGAQSESL